MLSPTHEWHSAPPELFLGNDEVHIWYTSLDTLATQQTQFWLMLSEDERTRAQRFRFEIHRQRFIVGRGILRTLLGRYSHTPPESIAFSYSANGKPFLMPSDSTLGIEFNASHSHELALFACTREQAIGVDIEYMRAFPDTQAIVNNFFSHQEQQAFSALPASKQTASFFAAWTRKEAYLKACGDGLSLPLSQFEVSMEPEQEARILAIGGSREKAAFWFLQEIVVPTPDYKAALVLKGRKPSEIRYWLYK
jgi:4'-phosphopantetheinyl transferase